MQLSTTEVAQAVAAYLSKQGKIPIADAGKLKTVKVHGVVQNPTDGQGYQQFDFFDPI